MVSEHAESNIVSEKAAVCSVNEGWRLVCNTIVTQKCTIPDSSAAGCVDRFKCGNLMALAAVFFGKFVLHRI